MVVDRAKLTMLEQTVWWDALAEDTTIGRALDAMWRAFRAREERLVKCIEASLRAGRHQTAADDFRRLIEMVPLWAADPVTTPSRGSELMNDFDMFIGGVDKLIGTKVSTARSWVERSSWSAGEDKRVDRSVLDGLKHADAFISLATHMSVFDEWLTSTAELQHAGSQ
jgi:hypothetical protein